jgi:hypothetical protein
LRFKGMASQKIFAFDAVKDKPDNGSEKRGCEAQRGARRSGRRYPAGVPRTQSAEPASDPLTNFLIFKNSMSRLSRLDRALTMMPLRGGAMTC